MEIIPNSTLAEDAETLLVLAKALGKSESWLCRRVKRSDLSVTAVSKWRGGGWREGV